MHSLQVMVIGTEELCPHRFVANLLYRQKNNDHENPSYATSHAVPGHLGRNLLFLDTRDPCRDQKCNSWGDSLDLSGSVVVKSHLSHAQSISDLFTLSTSEPSADGSNRKDSSRSHLRSAHWQSILRNPPGFHVNKSPPAARKCAENQNVDERQSFESPPVILESEDDEKCKDGSSDQVDPIETGQAPPPFNKKKRARSSSASMSSIRDSSISWVQTTYPITSKDGRENPTGASSHLVAEEKISGARLSESIDDIRHRIHLHRQLWCPRPWRRSWKERLERTRSFSTPRISSKRFFSTSPTPTPTKRRSISQSGPVKREWFFKSDGEDEDEGKEQPAGEKGSPKPLIANTFAMANVYDQFVNIGFAAVYAYLINETGFRFTLLCETEYVICLVDCDSLGVKKQHRYVETLLKNLHTRDAHIRRFIVLCMCAKRTCRCRQRSLDGGYRRSSRKPAKYVKFAKTARLKIAHWFFGDFESAQKLWQAVVLDVAETQGLIRKTHWLSGPRCSSAISADRSKREGREELISPCCLIL